MEVCEQRRAVESASGARAVSAPTGALPRPLPKTRTPPALPPLPANGLPPGVSAATLAIEQHRQGLEVYLAQWGRGFELLVAELLAELKTAGGGGAAAALSRRSTAGGSGGPPSARRWLSLARGQSASGATPIDVAQEPGERREVSKDFARACGGSEGDISRAADDDCSSGDGAHRFAPQPASASAWLQNDEGECVSKLPSNPALQEVEDAVQIAVPLEAETAELSPRSPGCEDKGGELGCHSSADELAPTTSMPTVKSLFKDRHAAMMLGLNESNPIDTTPSFAKGCCEGLELMLLEPPRPRPGAFRNVARVVSSKRFEALAACVICSNAIYIAYASDQEIWRVTNGASPASSWEFWLELGFTFWYAFELSLRLYIYGTGFYMCEDWKWNAFDTVLVVVSLQDALNSAGSSSPAFLRIMRLARMMKLLRVIRLMRMFRELRLILNAMLGCAKSMFWATILIMNVSFVFGLCFLQATTDYLQDMSGRTDPTLESQLLKYWGSVGTSMYSLYAAALGGLDWDKQARTLEEIGTVFWLLFLLYIFFFFCVVTNILTSLFVEATMINAEKDTDQIIQAELEQKEVYIQKLKHFFLKVGGRNGEQVSMDSFIAHLQDPEMVYFAATIGIDTVDLKQFFTVLSAGGKEAIDVEAFVVGCIKLKGAAKSMDLMDVKINITRENRELKKMIKLIDRRLDAVVNVVVSEKVYMDTSIQSR